MATAYAPWTFRLLERTSLPPGWVGAGIALGAFLAAHLYYAGLSALGFETAWDISRETVLGEAVLALLLGYIIVANRYAVRGVLRDLDEVAPLLDATDAELARERRELVAFDPRVMRAAGWSIALLSALQVLFDPNIWRPEGLPPLSDHVTWWLLFRNGLTGWFTGRVVAHQVGITRRFSRIGTRVRVDLLRIEALGPFARFGLRTVLLWILGTSIIGLLFVIGLAASSVPFIIAAVLSLALAALLTPVLGVRTRVREAKERELERVRAALERERAHALADSDGRPGRLADLVAYEQRVASVREWPFDTSVWLRFALYLAIGLGSWVGAALVERLLGSFLD